MIAIATEVVEANALLKTGQPREALTLAEAAARRSPDDRTVLQLLAQVSVRLGDLPRAEAALRAFRAIRPKADASLLLAQILILDGRVPEAKELLDEAAILDGRHGGVLIARGDILAQAGKRGEARTAYQRAAELDPYRAAGVARARLAALDRRRSSAPQR
jgi:Flp pilus assembly protein TadD